MADNHEPAQSSINVIEILRRRGSLFFYVAAVVVLIGVAHAYRSTPLYESRGVLLAELPNVTDDVSMVQTRPGDRVLIISQRVLTSENLQKIIDENGLYPELADRTAGAGRRGVGQHGPSPGAPELL